MTQQSGDAQPTGVARLLQLGEPSVSHGAEWPDYLALGITPQDIPALINIAIDRSLFSIENEADARGWGPVHAWRALAQLRAQEAVDPLLCLFHEVTDNDWVIEEMPDVFAMIGPAAFGALADYLADKTHPVHSRLVAATGLMEMGLAYPEVREQSVAALAGQLEGYLLNTPGMNGVLIANLVELTAVEYADLILAVFTLGQVDRFIAGDWRDVQVRLHGLESSPNPEKLRSTVRRVPPDPRPQGPQPKISSQANPKP